jgi:hypothetical protein
MSDRFGLRRSFEKGLLVKKLVVATLSVISFGCGDQPSLTHVNARIEVPPTLAFDEVLLGSSKTLALDVSNRGDDVLRICVDGTEHARCAAQASGVRPANTTFSVAFDGVTEEKKSWNVEKGATRQLLVTYAPAAEGPAGATLVLIHDGENGPSTLIELTGSAVGPRVELSPTDLDFGEVSVGRREELQINFINKTSFQTPVTIALEQQATVEFGLIGEAGEVPANQPLTTAIPADGSLAVTVWITPSNEGPIANGLSISYCAACNTRVPIHGIGVKPYFTVSPNSLDLGSLPEGTPASESFVVENAGNVGLTVEAIEIDGATTTEFMVASSVLPKVLLPGERMTSAVTYVGVTPGLDEGFVVVRTNAWNDPATAIDESIAQVSVRAQSVGPDIEAIPANVSFGTVDVGSSSIRNVLIENSGNEPLTVTAIRLDTATAEIGVELAPSVPATLQPGDSIPVTLGYRPSNSGMDSATLVIESNDLNEARLDIPASGIGGVANACTVAVTPSSVQFGLVQPNHTATLGVVVQSAGGQPCTFGNFSLNGNQELALDGAPGTLTLAAGESERIPISYTPTQNGNHVATLTFTSNDPSQAVVSVPVNGSSFPTDIVVTPPEVDFGTIPTNCRSNFRQVSIYNTGTSQETVSQIFLDPSSSGELILNPVSLPIALPAGAQSSLSLRYLPTDIGSDYGVLFIQHSASQVPVAVPLNGMSDPNAMVTDTFEQLPSPADVLFVVDNSYSMMEEQAVLGQNLGTFLSFAQGQGIDYQIGVTTTDVYEQPTGQHGELVGATRIITPATANKEQVFQSNVNVGIDGAPDEQGFEGAYLALSPANLAGPNAGFLRPGALLAVVIVSDEEDQSVDPNNTAQYRAVSFYQNFFQSLKPNGGFVLSAVVGTTNPDCTSVNGNAYYGPRYITMAQATGGVVASICDPNWGQALAQIGVRSFGLKKSFQLSSQAVANTISVTLDGQPANAGAWTYDVNTNTVNFAVEPPSYTTIAISYSVQCM